VCQLLGESLDEPSDFVIAWTEGGVPVGGSATVLQLASARGIPVINLGRAEYSGADSETILRRIPLQISSSNQ
jgi:hypothetical protein